MNSVETRRYEMFRRVDQFGGDYAEWFPEGSVGRQAFGRVRAASTELATHTVERRKMRGEAVDSKARTRASLTDLLVRVRRTAQVMAVKRIGPDKRFELPSRNSSQTLLAVAKAFADDAEPFAADFIAHGMPATFMADLRAAIAVFEQAMQRRANGQSGVADSRLRIRAAIIDGLAAVRELDAIVANVLSGDARALQFWQHERRIGPARAASDPAATAKTPAIAAPLTRPDAGGEERDARDDRSERDARNKPAA